MSYAGERLLKAVKEMRAKLRVNRIKDSLGVDDVTANLLVNNWLAACAEAEGKPEIGQAAYDAAVKIGLEIVSKNKTAKREWI